MLRTQIWTLIIAWVEAQKSLQDVKLISLILKRKINKKSRVIVAFRRIRVIIYEVRYTLSVKLSDFIGWRHNWRKNWVNCAVLTGKNAGIRTVLSSRLSRTENCAVHSENPTVSSVYEPTPRWHHLKTHPFLAIHSADEHRMIYCISNTTSYPTYNAFFSSFRITLWPMWLANSKRQPCLYPPQSHEQEDTQNWPKKTDKPDRKPVLCQRTFSSVFRAVFFFT